MDMSVKYSLEGRDPPFADPSLIKVGSIERYKPTQQKC